MSASPPALPQLFAGICDDAAVFPPGNLPLVDAVPAHARHRAGAYAGVVGSFVLGAKDLDRLAELTRELAPGSLPLSLTTPEPAAVADALAAAAAIPAVRLAGLEGEVPAQLPATTVVPTLQAALDGRPDAPGQGALPTYVELPRDGRREALLAQLTGAESAFRAKLRTGGVRADLYPDEHELAATVLAAVRAGVAFKATAGLHHAVRNTDPETGFEQHGFLNLMTTASAAAEGADHAALVDLLAERDPAAVADRVRGIDPRVRQTFHSFGTCSIAEPVAELVDLGLLPADHLTDQLRSDLTEAPP